MLSAACLIWLERLQPLFLSVALASLAWQVWAVRRSQSRKRSVNAILIASVSLNVLLIGGWLVLRLRYL